jgi:hypothetical protein
MTFIVRAALTFYGFLRVWQMACLVYASDAVALTPREWNFLFGPPSSSCFSFSLQGGLSLRESMQAIQIEYHEQAKETDRR